ncbi:MAG: undecaprenyl-diphosphate phosphatase [Gammaproteobacteria bacterium]|nr:undecaprenyl-diphosphate phosphatase [Gammaproteobacteria bacterium]
MDTWHIAALAILQGLTEFLPVSSSAHLILLPRLTGWADQGLAFDIAVHVGSLLAVLAYFRKDLKILLKQWMSSSNSPESRLVWAVLFGTIPVGAVGLLLGDYVDTHLRSAAVICASTVLFGIVLGVADKLGERQRDEYTLTWRDVLLIGFAQALALIPGTSRSGITITAALMLGLQRKAAARFSFLLSIPVIILAGGHKTIELVRSSVAVEWGGLLLGVGLSAFSAYFCIRVFISLLDRIGMLPFVIYRLLLGAILYFALLK